MFSPHSLSVLIVEDHQDCADSTAELLRLYGHVPQIARNGAEAVELVKIFPPDVVLMDIGLPGADGYTEARRLCKVMGHKPLLVALTGFGNLEDRSREEGFDHHFVKPVDPSALVSFIEQHAEQIPVVLGS